MYNGSISNFYECTDDLQPQFYNQMFEAEQKYLKSRDEETIKQLLCYYTDCVNYFELKQQSISQYFQFKIKELVRQIKQFGTHQLAEINKQKMSKDIIRVMQAQNIQQQISKSMKKEQKVSEAVTKIISQQNQRLEKRILKTKRTMGKSFSVQMSMGSIDSSPEPKQKPKAPLGLSQKFLFTKQINSDQDVSTS